MTTATPAPRFRRLAAIAAVALALCTTACGGGSDSTSDSASVPSGLEPQPLSEPTTLTVTMGTKAEVNAAILLADKLGEFAKENITIDLQMLPSADAIPALAQGKSDVASTGLGAVYFNGVHSGADMRLVFPGATKNPADGLYVPIDPATGQPGEVTKIATISGAGNMYIVPIERYLTSVGKSVSDVTFEKIELADMQSALENGAVDAAWVNAPVTTLLDATGEYKRVVGYEDGEYGIGYLLGPNLLHENPAAGQAFVRTLARTIRDHLSGDYKADDATVAAMAEVLESTPEAIRQTPSMTFGAELPTDGLQAAQAAWLAIGDLLEYEAPLEPSAYLDPAFLDRALSKS